jgi:hypothetical protein
MPICTEKRRQGCIFVDLRCVRGGRPLSFACIFPRRRKLTSHDAYIFLRQSCNEILIGQSLTGGQCQLFLFVFFFEQVLLEVLLL